MSPIICSKIMSCHVFPQMSATCPNEGKVMSCVSPNGSFLKECSVFPHRNANWRYDS